MHDILVIGGGSIGERHVRCIVATKRTQVSLCEMNKDLLNQVADRYSLAQRFDDFDSIDLAQFDGVVICTPANLHVAQARKVIAAGVNLFCEKPLTVQDEGVTELLAEIDRAKVVAGVGFTWRYMPWAREMLKQVQAGTIGQLKYVNIRLGQHFPCFRPAYRDTYFTTLSSGGGAILDGSSHMVSLTQMFAGPVASVSGMYGNSGQLGVDVEDNVDMLLQMADGGWANVHVNLWQKPTEGYISLTGTKGSIRYIVEQQTMGICLENNGPWEEKTFQSERDAYYIAEADNFLNAIEHKEQPFCSVPEAYHTNKICWALRKSFDQKQWIDIPD